VPALDGTRTLRDVLDQRAAELGLDATGAGEFEAAALPVVRRLLELGMLAWR
jgi:hypothetical protein